MKKIENFKQRSIQALISAVCSILIGVCLYPLLFGMPLTGMPAKGDVKEIRLEYAGKTVTLTDAEQVSLALNMTAYLKYKPFKEATMGEKSVSMTLFTEDGEEIALTGSENEVTYKDKTHPLKQDGLFMKGITALYFGE